MDRYVVVDARVSQFVGLTRLKGKPAALDYTKARN